MWIKSYYLYYYAIIGISWITSVANGAILDSRCYLEGGGSAESFLATEDLTVGSIIGKLRINGDPNAETGDINLSLREKNAPVEIVAGTKDLALSVELDKEGLRGPSSIYVNVICVRRRSTDPSFVIPVNVRVTDVNDNAPQWIGTPYTLTLSEVTVPGTRILQGARAEDADQPGPFSTVEYQVLPGPYAQLVQFLNPLEGTLVLKKALDYEQLQNFTVKLRAQDQGTPPRHSDTLLRVVITDADDQNPKFLRESYSAELPADGRAGELRMRPEPLKAVDQDEGICAPIQYTIVQSQDAKYFRVHPHNGVITLLTPIGYADLTHGATLVVKATQIDNPDRYALTTVQLTRPGTHSDLSSLTFVQKRFVMRIREDTAVGNRILALPTNKPGKHLKYTIADPINSQFFSVGSLGELVLAKPLDYEKMTKHEFQVIASDGLTNSTSAEVTLEVIDVNDWEPRFRETHYEFMVPKSQSLQSRADSFEGVLIGKVEAADGDRNDKLELSLRGQHAGLFEIDATGNIYMRPEQLQSLNESTVHLIAIATDSGVPPRSTSVPVSVTMEGLTLAQSSWNNSMLGMFGMIVGLFLLIIMALSCYIVRSKKQRKGSSGGLSLGRNRVHSQAHSSVSSANLVTHEKLAGNANGASVTSGGVSVLHMKHAAGNNMTLTNPINNGLHHVGSGASSSMALGNAVNLLERERERERERQRESYAATVRIFLPGIVSRASANGQLYEEDEIEHDSLSQHDQQQTTPENNNRKTVTAGVGGVTTISTTSNGNAIGAASNLLSASDTMGSSENNLTVYF
ncbi:protocadherin gamma-B1 isoform X1 [Drosophila sulfurigaster albostrigata]|uniref:protocadherin gamma-B1 isoform X1 n=1 Tax=Drosophila sulfurigaster albostrigata TaxID=89887 RepID=UPI002D21B492|nr:protocadherin gamma-B1 isoform X1 [Drosophila sulfurigaster albostrigata]XP_062126298.1 protocadherin gamma-B1 isoform X1 [Drosophila sulfurigaster albostrigata]XP_062126299.1 protocadherin gamma-B1 isoform X1 [Drosophila sulfurigaster albostrigata]